MKHFGDITKLHGYDLPVVDVITGGSPCQDLSIAGGRAGLDGEIVEETIDVADIKALPSTQPRWIPRSEKLPEERTKVLATVLVPHRESIVISAEYLMSTFYCDNGDCWMADDEEVVAWMPLPQPYKGEQE
jgi:hypothetical protein